MTWEGKLYEGTYGQTFEVSTGIDLSGAREAKLIIIKPSGIKKIWSLEFVEPKTAGVVKREILEGDLNESGIYRGQVEVIWASKKLLGDTFTFKVWKEGT